MARAIIRGIVLVFGSVIVIGVGGLILAHFYW